MRGRTLIDLGRTLLAAFVLYAFALQGFVGSLAKAEGGIGPLCTHQGSGPPAPTVPADGHSSCCVVACMAVAAVAPPLETTDVRPSRPTSMVTWRLPAVLRLAPAFPPAFHARGPPSA